MKSGERLRIEACGRPSHFTLITPNIDSRLMISKIRYGSPPEDAAPAAGSAG